MLRGDVACDIGTLRQRYQRSNDIHGRQVTALQHPSDDGQSHIKKNRIKGLSDCSPAILPTRGETRPLPELLFEQLRKD